MAGILDFVDYGLRLHFLPHVQYGWWQHGVLHAPYDEGWEVAKLRQSLFYALHFGIGGIAFLYWNIARPAQQRGACLRSRVGRFVRFHDDRGEVLGMVSCANQCGFYVAVSFQDK